MNHSSLSYILYNIVDARNTILQCLSASDIALLFQVLKIDSSQLEFKRFLDPIRDFGTISSQIKSCINDGYTVFLLGTDTEKLLKRIRTPLAFYKQYGVSHTLYIHIVMTRFVDTPIERSLEIKSFEGLTYRQNGSWTENKIVDSHNINILSCNHSLTDLNSLTINIGSFYNYDITQEYTRLTQHVDTISLKLIKQDGFKFSSVSYISISKNDFTAKTLPEIARPSYIDSINRGQLAGNNMNIILVIDPKFEIGTTSSVQLVI